MEKKMAVLTAEFIAKINQLFENLNRYSKYSNNPYKCALSEKTSYIASKLCTSWIEYNHVCTKAR